MDRGCRVVIIILIYYIVRAWRPSLKSLFICVLYDIIVIIFTPGINPLQILRSRTRLCKNEHLILSSINTAMPYSGSVSMNRNTPKAKNSPKWRPKPSINKTNNFMEKPNFTTRTGKLVEVLFRRRHCNSRDNLTLLCTYFVANKRYSQQE